MERINISLTERGSSREVSEIRVDGVIDTMSAGELEDVIDSLLKRDRFQIVVDLAGVESISSAGWGIIISHIKEVRSQGGDIKLAGMVPDVREIFEILELYKILTPYGSVDDALDAFAQAANSTEPKKKQ